MSKPTRPTGRHQIALDIPAVHRGVRVARNVVRRFARMQGISGPEVDYLVLVVSELLANVIDHGGGCAAMVEEDLEGDVRMHLEFTISSVGWCLRVTDHGGGDPAKLQAMFEPDGLPDLEDDRGRGLYLLAQMVDQMEVVQNEQGDGLTFVAQKRLEP